MAAAYHGSSAIQKRQTRVWVDGWVITFQFQPFVRQSWPDPEGWCNRIMTFYTSIKFISSFKIKNGQILRRCTRLFLGVTIKYFSCFDLFHYGHANAIRQSREMADWLIAGCHSDEAIAENKGPPVMTQSERMMLLKGCRWVDEVVPDAPYTTEIEFIARYGIDFVAHGDDITTDADGLDSYRLVKEAGLYRQFPRTPGVSTTDALARILHPSDPSTSDLGTDLGIDLSVLNAFLASASTSVPQGLKVLKSSMSQTSDLDGPTLRLEGHTLALTRPLDGRPTIYLHGTFDLFSSGDLLGLQTASKDGQLNLLVGIWGGDDVARKLGKRCIWNFQERALGVLQCRYVTGLLMPAIPPHIFDQLKTEGDELVIDHHQFCPDSSSDTIQSILARQDEFLARQKRKLSKSTLEKQLANQC